MAENSLELYQRAFEAIGYGCEILGNTDLAHEADEGIRFFEQYGGHNVFRERIVTSIRDRGRPVLALGVIGPPECCVVAGYDEGGDVLVGWSFFQSMTEMVGEVETEPSGYFRQVNLSVEKQLPVQFNYRDGVTKASPTRPIVDC